jgi:hypothetical protein
MVFTSPRMSNFTHTVMRVERYFIQLLYLKNYIYIYIYLCGCVCVCFQSTTAKFIIQFSGNTFRLFWPSTGHLHKRFKTGYM